MSNRKTIELKIADLQVLDDAGSLDWSLADDPVFQKYVRMHGSPEQECRLADLNVEYLMSSRACAWKIEQMRKSGELQRFQRAFAARKVPKLPERSA